MSAPSITGELEYGIEYDGVRHYDFELRTFTVNDNVEALVEVGSGAAMRVTQAMLARALVRVGSIPKTDITTELVGTMVEDDYDLLLAKQGELKKKLKRPSATSSPSDSQSSSSAGTVSPSPASGG